MATEDGCHWVVLGLSKNNMRYSTQNKEAGNLALEITKTLEYRALIKKMTEMVNDEQSKLMDYFSYKSLDDRKWNYFLVCHYKYAACCLI